jgi:hypothetical protein
VPLPHIYVEEPCPLDGYDGLNVRVLGNATDREWREWAGATLGDPDCGKCKALNPLIPPDPALARLYCPACTAARAAWGRSIVLLYGPRLLDHDVSTPEAALALFDDDDALPTEIVIWIQLLPGVVRLRRQEALIPNLTGSLVTPST